MSSSCKFPLRDKGIIILNHLQPQACNTAEYICSTLFAKICLSSLKKHFWLCKKKKKSQTTNKYYFLSIKHISYWVNWTLCFFALELCSNWYLYYYCFKNLILMILSFTEISTNHWNQTSNTEVHSHSMVREDMIRFLKDIAHFKAADVSNPANTLE